MTLTKAPNSSLYLQRMILLKHSSCGVDKEITCVVSEWNARDFRFLRKRHHHVKYVTYRLYRSTIDVIQPMTYHYCFISSMFSISTSATYLGGEEATLV
jgi:hypothetical protein